MELAQKKAVITGAGSGIGRALCEAAAQAGMKVWGVDIDEAALTETAHHLEGKGVDGASPAWEQSVVDVSDKDALEHLAEEVFAKWGEVNLLVNNAGVAGLPAPSWELSHEQWDWVIGVNLSSVIHGQRAFLPRMLKTKAPGHVVNTASMAGLLTLPFLGPYHVTKHGVVALSEVLHHELATIGAPIGVSVVCPGFVKTNIMNIGRYGTANEPSATTDNEGAKQVLAGMMGAMQKAVEEGPSPSDIATAILDAVVANKFYVLTHKRELKAFKKRADRLLAEEDPQFGFGG